MLEELKSLVKGQKYINTNDGKMRMKDVTTEELEKQYGYEIGYNAALDWVDHRISELQVHPHKEDMEAFFKGEWVDTQIVEEMLGIDFKTGLRLFDFSRTAEWCKPPKNGQIITTKFRLKRKDTMLYMYFDNVTKKFTVNREKEAPHERYVMVWRSHQNTYVEKYETYDGRKLAIAYTKEQYQDAEGAVQAIRDNVSRANSIDLGACHLYCWEIPAEKFDEYASNLVPREVEV